MIKKWLCLKVMGDFDELFSRNLLQWTENRVFISLNAYHKSPRTFQGMHDQNVFLFAASLTVHKPPNASLADWNKPTLTLWLFCSCLISSFSLSHSAFSSSSRWHAPWASCRAPSSSASRRCSLRSDRASRLRELWRVNAGQSSTGRKEKR